MKKYLDYDLFECISKEPADPKLQQQWEKCYRIWWNVFCKYKNRYPHNFVNEFSKTHFHDYRISDFKIELNENNDSIAIYMNLKSGERIFSIKFEEISNFSVNLFMAHKSLWEWIVCEISPVNKTDNYASIYTNRGILTFIFKNMQFA